MASLIVWLCVHVSKFNTVCVVEHRGGIRAAEQQQQRAAAEQQQSIPYSYGIKTCFYSV